MPSSDPKFSYRIAAPIFAAVLLASCYLFGNSIVAVLAYEGTIIGDLRLMRAQASLAVWEHNRDDRSRGEAERN